MLEYFSKHYETNCKKQYIYKQYNVQSHMQPLTIYIQQYDTLNPTIWDKYVLACDRL